MASSGYCAPTLAGTAVDALVVAAVGDGDAQIVNDAAVAVSQPGEAIASAGTVGNQQPSAAFKAIPFCRCRITEVGPKRAAISRDGDSEARGRRVDCSRASLSVDARRSFAEHQAGNADEDDDHAEGKRAK